VVVSHEGREPRVAHIIVEAGVVSEGREGVLHVIFSVLVSIVHGSQKRAEVCNIGVVALVVVGRAVVVVVVVHVIVWKSRKVGHGVAVAVTTAQNAHVEERGH